MADLRITSVDQDRVVIYRRSPGYLEVVCPANEDEGIVGWTKQFPYQTDHTMTPDMAVRIRATEGYQSHPESIETYLQIVHTDCNTDLSFGLGQGDAQTGVLLDQIMIDLLLGRPVWWLPKADGNGSGELMVNSDDSGDLRLINTPMSSGDRLRVAYQDREYEANINVWDAKPIYLRFVRTGDYDFPE